VSGTGRIAWISPHDPPDSFPDVESALREPDGLLAAGGDLSTVRLLEAYRRGIFPWFDDGQPILWWSPDPRCVLFPDEFHLPRRLARDMRRSSAEIHFNRRFDDVISACAEPRASQQGTWITSDMQVAYAKLHEEGWAHSIEVWEEGSMIGGIYGVAIGRVFFGESMFSRRANASKYALFALSQILSARGFEVIDCQVASRHLMTLGSVLVPRKEFSAILDASCRSLSSALTWPESPQAVAALVSNQSSIALQ
jgi:leucyl/phenylalanyl-tRNA--protein transferase